MVLVPLVVKRFVEEAFVAAKLLVAVAFVKVTLASVVRPVTFNVE